MLLEQSEVVLDTVSIETRALLEAVVGPLDEGEHLLVAVSKQVHDLVLRS